LRRGEASTETTERHATARHCSKARHE
jgi:hypothetical protein